MRSPLTGCGNAARHACRAWRGNASSAATSAGLVIGAACKSCETRPERYTGSPTIGQPRDARWTRIWCRRPVRRRQRSSDKAGPGARTRPSRSKRVRLAAAIARIDVESRCDLAARSVHASVDDGQIVFLDRCPLQRGMSGRGLRHEDEPRRALVEPSDE